ncbi:nucleoside hydrolase [Microbacterium kribbense]|uniref:Nucleoside hydrolase n=1 Tax=Microbacterium kribbense TaxID=433645 RepID=A0ABP7G2K7_9MICO
MHKIILDCDPGHDDAIAILLAAGNPMIDLLAITTVAGNQTIEKVTRNALSVCAIAGIEVPVARGADRPLVEPQRVAGDIHGASGLDGPVLPAPAFVLDERHAVTLLVDTVMAHEPGEITLVATGPLTNIALAMLTEPAIVDRVKRVVVMGGAYTRGNTTPAAEFNIAVDPEAAEAVFRGSWDVTMVGLDLTHQALATTELHERVRAIGGPVSRFVLDVWEFFGQTYRSVYGFEHPPIHDACCVAAVIDPTVFTTARADVRVELRGQWTRGMTVVDFADVLGMHHGTGRDYRADVAVQLDWGRFADLVVDAITRLGE